MYLFAHICTKNLLKAMCGGHTQGMRWDRTNLGASTSSQCTSYVILIFEPNTFSFFPVLNHPSWLIEVFSIFDNLSLLLWNSSLTVLWWPFSPFLEKEVMGVSSRFNPLFLPLETAYTPARLTFWVCRLFKVFVPDLQTLAAGCHCYLKQHL